MMKRGSLSSLGLVIFTLGICMFILASSLVISYRASAESSIFNYRLYVIRTASNAESIKLMIDQERTYALDEAITYVGLAGGYIPDKFGSISVTCPSERTDICSQMGGCSVQAGSCTGTTNCSEVIKQGLLASYPQCDYESFYQNYDVRWLPQKNITKAGNVVDEKTFLNNVKTFVNERLKFFDPKFRALIKAYYGIDLDIRYRLENISYGEDNKLMTKWVSSIGGNTSLKGVNPAGETIVEYNFTSLNSEYYAFPLQKILEASKDFSTEYENLLKNIFAKDTTLSVVVGGGYSRSYNSGADTSSCSGDALCIWEVTHPES